jgi:hypothetical protein
MRDARARFVLALCALLSLFVAHGEQPARFVHSARLVQLTLVSCSVSADCWGVKWVTCAQVAGSSYYNTTTVAVGGQAPWCRCRPDQTPQYFTVGGSPCGTGNVRDCGECAIDAYAVVPDVCCAMTVAAAEADPKCIPGGATPSHGPTGK